MINAIVLIATLMAAAVIGIWIAFPHFRSSIEAPKFRFLELQDRFDPNGRIPMPPQPSSPSRSPLEASGGETFTQHNEK